MSPECIMRHLAYDQCPEYCALSYAWGSSERSIPIIVQGQSLLVTPNLLEALVHFRSGGVESWLWIDSICINQANDAEKSVQVQRMRLIYQNAKEMLAWLGPGEEKRQVDATILSTLKRVGDPIVQKFASTEGQIVGRNLRECKPPSIGGVRMQKKKSLELRLRRRVDMNRCANSQELFEIDLNQFTKALSSDTALTEELVCEIILKQYLRDSDDIDDLKCLLSQSIWTRIWVIQEFGSAREVVFMYAAERIRLQAFFVVWVVLFYYINQAINDPFSGGLDQIDKSIKSMAPLLLQSNVWMNGQKPRTLFELLRATGGFNAFDNRDKVFALLGIAEDAQEFGCIPIIASPTEKWPWR